MKNKLPLFRWTFLAVNLILLLVVIFFAAHRYFFRLRLPAPLETKFLTGPASFSQNYGRIPDFSLTEQSGQTVSSLDLKGKVWIADFIFTRCADQCPVMTQKMSFLRRKMETVQCVSFSVDPEYDNPSVLQGYAKKFEADPARWFFLTGKKEAMNRVAQGLHVSGTEQPMFHNISFILVDREGYIRGYYNSSEPEKIRQLERDAKTLLA